MYHFEDLATDQFKYLDPNILAGEYRLTNTLNVVRSMIGDINVLVEWNDNILNPFYVGSPLEIMLLITQRLKDLEQTDTAKEIFVQNTINFIQKLTALPNSPKADEVNVEYIQKLMERYRESKNDLSKKNAELEKFVDDYAYTSFDKEAKKAFNEKMNTSFKAIENVIKEIKEKDTQKKWKSNLDSLKGHVAVYI